MHKTPSKRAGHGKDYRISEEELTWLGEQVEELGRVVLAAIDGRDRVEFRHFCRLACGVWSDFLDEEVAKRMQSADAGIRRRALWVAEAAVSAGKA